MSEIPNECPICGASVALRQSPMRGELLDCGDCGSELEISSLEPLQLSAAPREAEDWGQ